MSLPDLQHHLRSLVEQRLEQLGRALEQSRRARAVEAVHDLRVASRRLRAFGVTFRELLGTDLRRRLEKKLRRVTRAVGDLRDLDVQRELLEGRLAATSPELDLERAALEHLLEHLTLLRGKVARRAARRLRQVDVRVSSRLVRRALRAVQAALSAREQGGGEPGRGHAVYARAVLEGLVAEAAEQLAPAEGPDDPGRLHQLRIEIKELRYALELLEPVLGSQFPVLYARAAALQELLGAHHDLVTLADVVTESSAELREKGREALARGLDRVLASLSTELAAVLGRLKTAGFDPDWWREALARPRSAG
jgi:CHAD domain-containing protein